MSKYETAAEDTSSRLRWSLLRTIPGVMLGMSILILMSNIPDGEIISLYGAQSLIYLFLTGFALYFGVWLSRGALSPAHAVGMVAFLSLPVEALPLMVWAISLGGVSGGLTLIMRRQVIAQPDWHTRLNMIAMITARVTISFYAAAQVYIALDGSLPLQSEAWATDAATPLALVVYTLVYFTLYAAIYTLEIYNNGLAVGEMIRNNLSLILVILLLPLPFAIISAELASGLQQPAEILSLIGMAVIILGLHAISRSEQQTRKQLQELMTLSIVTRAMRAHLQPDSLLKTIYVQVSELFDTPADFTLLIYDKDYTQVIASLVIKQNIERVNVVPEELHDFVLISRVLSSRVPLFLADNVATRAKQMGLTIHEVEPLYSWMGVPLLIGSMGNGVIVVSSDDPQRLFTAGDLRLLTIIADSASIAIENAQLFERQSQRVAQLSMLNNVASLLSGTLSPNNVVDTILSSASAVSDANGIALFLYQDDDLKLMRTAGLSDQYDIDAPLIVMDTDDRPLAKRKPLGIGDIFIDERAKPLRSAIQHEGYRGLIELPLSLGDRVLGVLQLFYAAVQTITDESLELLRTYATQAAQAISNAQTYATTDEAFQRSVEQLLALAGIGRLLTSTIDLKTISDMVLQHVIDSTNASSGVVALLDERRGHELQLMAQAILDEEGALIDTAAIHSGASQKALQTAQIQRISDVRQLTMDNVRMLEATRAQLAVPILRGRDVLGLILLESNRVAAFSPEDSHFVAQVANQAVIAIDNARLFQRITEARDRLQVILDTMEEAILLLDARGEVALANPRITLLDMMPDELIGHKLSDLLDNGYPDLLRRIGFDDATVFHKMVASIEQENAWAEYPPHLYAIQSQDGLTRYIQRYVIPVLDDRAQTMGVLLVFYDKTDEQELHRAREELTRMIVHDLRSPLTAVTTGLKLLQDYVPEDNSVYNLVQNTAQTSRQAVRKLLGRVDSLLDISKMQSGRLNIERSQIALDDIIDTVRDELHPLSSELDIKIVDELPDALPQLYVDRDKVERLLLNLLDNALKYSPTESTITVRAHAPGVDNAQAGYIRVDVIDIGPGVPDDYKQSLFNSFVQVEGRATVRRGVGLGLSFCRLVTEAHAGAIWIEDNKPTGSIFSVTLPSVLAPVPSNEPL